MGEFRMPALGVEMAEGRLVEWLVEPGQEVRRGDLIAVVETDKAAIEVEVWEDGTVEELLVGEGTKVPVGTPLARLVPTQTDATAPAARTPARAHPAPGARAVPAPVRGPLARHRAEELGVDLTSVEGTGIGGAITRHDVELAGHATANRQSDAARAGRDARVRVSPYARRVAEERGLDPSTFAGSGPGGAVVARDLAAEHLPGSGSSEPPGAGEATDVATPPRVRQLEGTPEPAPGTSMRDAIARAMDRANREIPHYYLGTHVDITDTVRWLASRNDGRPPTERLLLPAIQLKAVAVALRDHRELNGHWVDGRFHPADSIDVGVAIALRGGGLVAPAIANTDTLDLDALMARLRELVHRARAGRLRSSEAASPTITVTNLGDLGVETVYGVITPPQVALVGFGRPTERPGVVDGMIGVRQIVDVTLAADHRQTDGVIGARYLNDVERLIRRPEEL